MHSSIGLALIVEGLDEMLRRAAHIAEVDEEDLILLAEVADNPRQVVGHQGEVALAQGDAVDRTG
jgi:hypothetical protein